MTTISLPLAVWGEEYVHFIPKWWNGVRLLKRQPDEIVLVSDNDLLLESVPDWVHVPVKRIRSVHHDFAEWWNIAVLNCTSEWFAICNVDDYFLPDALSEVDEAERQGCNFLVDKLQVKQTGEIWSGVWDPETIPQRFTLPGAEPMRRDLFFEAGGYRKGFRFVDWALAVDIIHKGLAKPFTASTVRAVFDNGSDRLTMSGNMLDSLARDEGSAQVRQLSAQLGLLPVQ